MINAFPPSQPLPPPQSASLLKRFLALGYDVFILAALSMAYSAIATLVMVHIFQITTQGDYRPMTEGMGFGLGWIATLIGFYWFFWQRAGQTIGMRAWRIKVVAINGERPSHRQILIRIAFGPLSLGLLGAGYWWCLFNKEGRAWHDLASGTRVIALPALNKNKPIKK